MTWKTNCDRLQFAYPYDRTQKIYQLGSWDHQYVRRVHQSTGERAIINLTSDRPGLKLSSPSAHSRCSEMNVCVPPSKKNHVKVLIPKVMVPGRLMQSSDCEKEMSVFQATQSMAFCYSSSSGLRQQVFKNTRDCFPDIRL